MQNGFYEKIGGRPTLDVVHKIFYDKVYADPWMAPFFKEIDQEFIQNQQSDFMGMHFGGPPLYRGGTPKAAHVDLFITREMIMHRARLLFDSIIEFGLSKEIANEWLFYERKFYAVIAKEKVSDCQKKAEGKPITVVPKPQR